MNKITLFKKFADGGLRSIEINDSQANVMHLLNNGYFLTKEEAETGKILEEEKPKPVRRKRVAKAEKAEQ